MAFCLAELHLWSTKSSLQVKDTDIGTYQYYDKGEPASPPEPHYYQHKARLCQARGYSWTPRNRRPEKLRDSLKELEELLQTNTCVRSRWRNKHWCQLMLSSGVLVTLALNGPQLQHVCIDRALAGRLPANTVADAVLSDRLILLSFLETSQAAAVYLHKKNQDSPETGRRTDKLSPSEIKVFSVEVTGRGRRLFRGLDLNCVQDTALCWWNQDPPDQELWPWSPSNDNRNNLVLLSSSSAEGLKVLSSARTDGALLSCAFSRHRPYELLAVEASTGGESWADVGVYECAKGRLRRRASTRVPLPCPPLSCSTHPSETAFLLGLSDSSLVLVDRRRGVSLLASCPVPPTLLAWHPAGAAVAVGGGQGELTLFDVGLAPVSVALVAEEVAPAATLRLFQHLRPSGGLQGLQWGAGPDGSPAGADLLMLAFHSGPLAALRFRLGALTGGRMGPETLLRQRLRCGQVKEALNILEAMDWSAAGEQCFRGLGSIAQHLLRLPLNPETEAQLQATLGVFYAPSVRLPDGVVSEYREPVRSYARRFFHHLLRHQRLEKAFLLAVDLEDRDLFMDLHYVAGDKGEPVLAEVAKRKANEIEARAVAGHDPPKTMSGVCGSSLGEEHPVRNQNGSGPSHPSADGRASRERPRTSESLRVTVNPDVFRPLTGTGGVQGDADGGSEEDGPETLRVVHLGSV